MSVNQKRIKQNKGNESENSYQKLKRSLKGRHTKRHRNCIEIFRQARPSLSIKRENISEHTTKMASLEFMKGATRGLREKWMEGNYLRLMPGLSLEDRTFALF